MPRQVWQGGTKFCVRERERERESKESGGDLTSRQDLVQHMYLHVCGLFSTLHLGVVSSDGEVCGAVCSSRTPDSKPTTPLCHKLPLIASCTLITRGSWEFSGSTLSSRRGLVEMWSLE